MLTNNYMRRLSCWLWVLGSIHHWGILPTQGGETFTINATTWTIPSDGGPLPPLSQVYVGDSLVFDWTGTHNVNRQVSANCSLSTEGDDVVFISDTPPATYQVENEDAGKTIYFTCRVGSHCESGMVMAVSVVDDYGRGDYEPSSFSVLNPSWTLALAILSGSVLMMGNGVEWTF